MTVLARPPRLPRSDPAAAALFGVFPLAGAFGPAGVPVGWPAVVPAGPRPGGRTLVPKAARLGVCLLVSGLVICPGAEVPRPGRRLVVARCGLTATGLSAEVGRVGGLRPGPAGEPGGPALCRGLCPSAGWLGSSSAAGQLGSSSGCRRPSSGWRRPSSGCWRPSPGWRRPSSGWWRPSSGWEWPSTQPRGWSRWWSRRCGASRRGDIFCEFVTFHIQVVFRLWAIGFLGVAVWLQAVDRDDLGALDVGPGGVQRDPYHRLAAGGFAAHRPGPGPECGQLSGCAMFGGRCEEEDLGSWDEGLSVLVVLAPLPSDGLQALFTHEFLHPVDPLIQPSYVFVVVSVAKRGRLQVP